MKKRMNESIICASPSQIKRPSLDGSFNHSQKLSSTGEFDYNAELPDADKLAKAKFFLMTENPNGKVLGFGEVVDIMPQNSQFVIRIYNRDFNNNGKLKDVVELTMEDINEIHAHKSEIEHKIKEARTRKIIFEFKDLKVFVGPGYNKNTQHTVEIVKAITMKSEIKSSMYIETFGRMMNCLPEVAEQHARFNQRQEEEIRIVHEILNTLAYNRNEKRPNNVIREPNVRAKSGIYNTAERIVNQAKTILPKLEA